jgi:hypothetical protein
MRIRAAAVLHSLSTLQQYQRWCRLYCSVPALYSVVSVLFISFATTRLCLKAAIFPLFFIPKPKFPIEHCWKRVYIYYEMSANWDTSCPGRAITEAVSRWLPTAAARVQSRVWSSGICGGQSAAGAGFLRVLRFPLPFIPPNSPISQSPGAGKIGQWVADVPRGPSLDSTPHYAN